MILGYLTRKMPGYFRHPGNNTYWYACNKLSYHWL